LPERKKEGLGEKKEGEKKKAFRKTLLFTHSHSLFPTPDTELCKKKKRRERKRKIRKETPINLKKKKEKEQGSHLLTTTNVFMIKLYIFFLARLVKERRRRGEEGGEAGDASS